MAEAPDLFISSSLSAPVSVLSRAKGMLVADIIPGLLLRVKGGAQGDAARENGVHVTNNPYKRCTITLQRCAEVRELA